VSDCDRTVLVIEDDPIDREAYARFFARHPGHRYQVLEAETGAEGLTLLEDTSVDCVVLDYNLPDVDGLHVLAELRKRPPELEIPVVMLTGAGSEKIAVETMKLGSQDYVVKDHANADAILRAVDNAIEKVRLRREIEGKRQALAEASREQLELKDKFLSHVSHELRTPLTAVHQFLSLCLDGLAGELTELQREYLETAFRNTQQLKKMIGDLMEATRAEAGKLRVETGLLEIRPLLEDVVATLRSRAEENGICLEIRAGEEPMPCVLADGARVRQILVNLIENAIKFTPRGGEIRVEVEEDDCGLLRVSVTDTGCGIGERGKGRIFDRLHQESAQSFESREGLGLGLAICKELVLLQGGRLWVESQLGQGSTFHFTLPVYSLAKAIKPALATETGLQPVVAVIRVDITPLDGASRRLGADQITGVRRLLETLVYYPSDVVVPKVWGHVDERSLCIVAPTDPKGLGAMLPRIRDRLEGHFAKKLPNARFRIAARVEATSVSDREMQLDTGLAKVAGHVERLMREADS